MTTTRRYKCSTWQSFAASAYLHIARSTAQTGGPSSGALGRWPVANPAPAFKLWENLWSRNVWLIRISDDVAVRMFSSEVAARNWCSGNGVSLL